MSSDDFADLKAELPFEVRRWLVFVDSVTSLVVHRGLDEQAKRDLAAISSKARQLAGKGWGV